MDKTIAELKTIWPNAEDHTIEKFLSGFMRRTKLVTDDHFTAFRLVWPLAMI